MSTSGRWIGISLIIAVISLAIWALLRTPVPAPGQQGAPTRPAAAPAPRPTPVPRAGAIPPVEVERTTISTVDPQGRRQWEIRAAAVVVDSASNTAVLTAVQGTYFQEGVAAITFSAPRGTFYVDTRNMALAGGVRARAAASGRSIEADAVQWFPKTAQIEATGDVVLRQKGMTVRADRLTADVALRRTHLVGNIRVTVAE